MRAAHALLAAGLAVLSMRTVAAEAPAAEIVIGQSVPLSGPSAELGKEMRAGALAYFEHVNKQGGISGRRLRLESMDDAFQPERAAANYKALIERGAFLIFGCIGAATCNAAMPIITQANVPFVAPANGNEIMRTPVNRLVFHVRASFADEVEHIITHLTTVGITKVAVLHPNHAPGKAARATAEASLKKLNLGLAAAATYPGEDQLDVAPAIKAIAAVEPQAVIIFGPYRLAAEFVRGMKAAGQQPQFMALSVVGPRALAQALGDDGRGVGVTQVMPYPWVDTLPVLSEYQALYVKGGRNEPSFTSLEAFVSAKVLVEGLRRAGAQPTREKFVAAMESMSNYDAGGFQVSYSPTRRAGSHYVDITVIGKDRKLLR